MGKVKVGQTLYYMENLKGVYYVRSMIVEKVGSKYFYLKGSTLRASLDTLLIKETYTRRQLYESDEVLQVSARLGNLHNRLYQFNLFDIKNESLLEEIAKELGV